MKLNSHSLGRVTLVLIALLVVALWFLAPVASAAGDAPTPPDLTSTVGQILVWLAASGVIAVGVNYLFGWFPQFGEKYPQIQKYIQGALVAVLTALVTYIANTLPQAWMDLRAFDVLVAIIGALVTWAGTLVGKRAGTQHLSTHLMDADEIKRFMAKTTIVLAVLGASLGAGLLIPTLTYAGAPDYQYALVQCSGLSLAELTIAEQKFDTWYGWQHNLTTSAEWIGTYEARVNEFATTLGCQPVLDSGALTFRAKVYLPWYRFYLTEYPTPY